MKNNSIFLIVIAVLIVIFHEFILGTGYICYISAKYLIVSVIPETFNRVVYIKDNNDAYNNYIDERYGVLSKTFKMHTDGRFYFVSAPFIEKEFSIQIHKGNIESDNFCETLSTDPKFQHLYSEWVKKQVGIEDENVEIEFAGNFDQPYIEFDKIITLSEDYREIFENTHNLYVWLCRVKNISELNNTNKKDIAESIRKEYLYKMLEITGISKDISKNYFGHIELSNGNFIKDKNLNYSFRFNARVENSKLEELNY